MSGSEAWWKTVLRSGRPVAAGPHSDCPSVGVERTGRAVRFARLIHRPVRVLGGPAVRAASGDNPKLALVIMRGADGSRSSR